MTYPSAASVAAFPRSASITATSASTSALRFAFTSRPRSARVRIDSMPFVGSLTFFLLHGFFSLPVPLVNVDRRLLRGKFEHSLISLNPHLAHNNFFFPLLLLVHVRRFRLQYRDDLPLRPNQILRIVLDRFRRGRRVMHVNQRHRLQRRTGSTVIASVLLPSAPVFRQIQLLPRRRRFLLLFRRILA